MKLTEKQLNALRALPDWIGVGRPAYVLGVSHSVLAALCGKGYAQREKPNEEWPYCYALTDAGRALLEQGA